VLPLLWGFPLVLSGPIDSMADDTSATALRTADIPFISRIPALDKSSSIMVRSISTRTTSTPAVPRASARSSSKSPSSSAPPTGTSSGTASGPPQIPPQGSGGICGGSPNGCWGNFSIETDTETTWPTTNRTVEVKEILQDTPQTSG
jgi:hypothetical protein